MTRLADLQTAVAPGAGVVARVQGTVVVAYPDTPEQHLVVRALLDLATEHAGRGRRLVRRVAVLLGDSEPEDTPDFAVLADVDGDAIAVVVHGRVVVSIRHEDGKVEEVSGADAATWVDRLLRGTTTLLEVGAGRPLNPPPWSDLVEGSVGGDGVVLAPRGAAIDHAAPAPPSVIEEAEPTIANPVVPAGPAVEAQPARPPREFVAVSLSSSGDDDLPREPLPLATEPPSRPERPRVRGVACSRSHFNDPRALYCGSCGISMVQKTQNVIEGERPPLGVLVRDDGATFVVDQNYVLGRDPSGDAAIGRGEAVALIVEDPDRATSRVHARLEIEGWDVKILDAGSVNGTGVAPPGAVDWTLVPAGGAVLQPGTRLLVGRRTFVYESHHRA